MSEDVTLDEFIESDGKKQNDQDSEQHLPEIDKIPSDWHLVTVEDIADDLIGGGTPSKSKEEYWGGEIPWASVKDLNGIELAETEDYITEGGVENSATNLIPEDSLVISTRMTVGEPFLNKVEMAINQDMKAIIPDKERVNPVFLVYSLWEKDPYLKSLGRGTTVDGITTRDLSLTHLGLPPLPEQRKIATVLHNVDGAIQKTEEIIKQMDTAQRGLLRSLFGKGETRQDTEGKTKIERLGPKQFKVPVTWDVTDISAIGRVVTGDTPSTDNEANFGGSLPFVTPETLSQGKYITRSERTLSDTGREEAKPIPDGSVMMDCIGSDMGKVAIADREVATNQQINSVVIEDSEYLPEFLYYHLRVLSDFIKSQAGQTATPIVNKSSFESFAIFKPPIEEQRDIVDTLSVYDEGRLINDEYLVELTRLKQGLMQDLLWGTVRTIDTNIEVPDEIAQYG